MSKDTIRPIYEELQARLAQAPSISRITDKTLWESSNTLVSKLSEVTEEDYSRFLIIPKIRQGSGYIRHEYIDTTTYTSNLGGLINWMHASYFNDENMPFSGNNGTLVSFSQSQNQQQSIQISLLQMQEKIIVSLNKPDISEPEKSFLSKLKERLADVTSVLQLVQLILTLANQHQVQVKRLIELLFSNG